MFGSGDSELEAPIHEALTRDILIWGCERNIFLLVALSTGFMVVTGFMDHRWWLVGLGAVLFFALIAPLQRMTKDDPKAPLIWARRLWEKRAYDATPRWDEPARGRRGKRLGDE